MENYVSIGILGLGRVSQRYFEVLSQELSCFRVTGVCDIDKSKGERWITMFGCEFFDNQDEFLKSQKFSVVIVLTESGHHYKHACAVIGAGKDVIIEKPPTLCPERFADLIEYSVNVDRKVFPIFQNRFNPSVSAVLSALKQGRFGKLIFCDAEVVWCRKQDYYEDGWHGTWLMDGGVLAQQAIHHLDICSLIVGDLGSVSGFSTRFSNRLEAEDSIYFLGIGMDNCGLTFKATTAVRPEDRWASLSVVGTEGQVKIEGVALNEITDWHFVKYEENDSDACDRLSESVPSGYGLSHGRNLKVIYDRLILGTPYQITSETVLRTLKTAHAVYSSCESGEQVKDCYDSRSLYWGGGNDC